MGYANTIPFVIAESTQGATFSNYIDVTNVLADKALGTINTIAYKRPISNAYARLYFSRFLDSSHAANALRYDVTTYLLLDDGTSTQNAGKLPMDYLGYTLADSLSGEQTIYFTTNIASYLKPSTTYTVTLKQASSVGATLRCFNPLVTVTMLGDV